MALTPGTRLGPYEILAALGAGAMGEVYRARDTKLRRDVAIKVLPPSVRDHPDRLSRFAREAQALAAINHPHIAAVYGLEQDDSGPFIVMELVEGATLDERLASLSEAEAIVIARQMTAALEAAHDRGVVHRDLKPANIKITPAGVVKILDFGLAKTDDARSDGERADAPTTAHDATEAGMVLGTAPYMSPEQARGFPVDRRTDIWAFGCVFFEMLAKVRAFPGSTVSDTLAALLTREPDWSRLPATTPQAVRRLLERCLRKDVTQRLRDIGDARLELDELKTDARESAAALSTAWPRGASIAVASAVLVSVIAVTVALWGRSITGSRASGDATAGPRFSRISWDASFSSEPALSPDGSLVVYASDRAGGGQLDLWIQNLSGGPPRRLTTDPADDREPDYSPDGSAIAFRSNRSGGGIYVMPPIGGDARLVAERGRTPKFSPPDGRRIAYWTGTWIGGPRTQGSAIFVVPSNGGLPTSVASGFPVAHHPIWSPDGRHLMFFGGRSPGGSAPVEFDWWRVSVDEGAEPVATGIYALLAERDLKGTEENNTVLPSPDSFPGEWTPEGILFAARLAQSVNLWRVRIADDGRVIRDSLQRLTSGAGEDMQPSARGKNRLAFSVMNSMNVSLTLPLDANAGIPRGPVVRHSAEAFVGSGGRNSLDASGRWLAYQKLRLSEGEIWLKDLTTGEERHLVTTAPSQLNPVISGNGRQVAYTVSETDGPVGYVISVDGGTARKVCAPCAFAGWFPDNQRIVIIVRPSEGTQRPEGRVQVLNVSDGNREDMLVAGGFAGRADLSPLGKWLSFSAEGAIWIAPARPGQPPARDEWIQVHQIGSNSGERACGWSPDGRLLYLLLEGDGFRDLYAQWIDPERGVPIGEPFAVEHLHDPRREWGSTPYGSAIVNGAFVFNQVESSASVWLMEMPGEQER